MFKVKVTVLGQDNVAEALEHGFHTNNSLEAFIFANWIYDPFQTDMSQMVGYEDDKSGRHSHTNCKAA